MQSVESIAILIRVIQRIVIYARCLSIPSGRRTNHLEERLLDQVQARTP